LKSFSEDTHDDGNISPGRVLIAGDTDNEEGTMDDHSDFTTDSGHDPPDQDPGAMHQSLEPPPGWDLSNAPGIDPAVGDLVDRTGVIDHQVETILAEIPHPDDPLADPTHTTDTTQAPFNIDDLPGMNPGVAIQIHLTDEIGRDTTGLEDRLANEQQPPESTPSTPPGSDPAATDNYLNTLEQIQYENQYADQIIQDS
jgi:hypothetical protein